jgi:hypothetical protein
VILMTRPSEGHHHAHTVVHEPETEEWYSPLQGHKPQRLPGRRCLHTETRQVTILKIRAVSFKMGMLVRGRRAGKKEGGGITLNLLS